MKNQTLLSVVFSLVVSSSIAFTAAAQSASNSDTSQPGQTQNSAALAKKAKRKNTRGTAKKGTANQVRTAQPKTALKSAPVSRKAVKQEAEAKSAQAKSIAQTGSNSANPAFNAGLSAPALGMATPVLKAQVKQSAPAAKVSPWTFKYVSINSLDMNAIENASPTSDQNELTAWDRFGINYAFSDKITTSIVAQTYHTWFGNASRVQDRDNPGLLQPGSFYWGDMYATLSDSEVYKFRGDVIFSAWTRWYFPTSEVSQKADQIGVWWTDLTLTKSIGIVDLKIHEEPRLYMQKYATSSLFDAAGNPEPLTDYKFYHLLEEDINVSSKWSFAFTEGLEQVHKFADSNINPTTGLPTPEAYATLIILNPEVDYTMNKVFSFALGIWEETPLNDSYHPFDAARGDDVAAYFQVNVAL